MTSGAGVAPHGLARAGALSFGGSLLGATLGFAFTVVAARALGAAGAGTVLQAVAVFMIALAVAKVGLDTAVVYLVPRLLSSSPSDVGGVVRLALTVSAGAGVACAALVYTGAWWADLTEGLTTAVSSVIWVLPLAAAFTVGVGALRALGDIKQYVLLSQLLVPGLRPLGVLLVALAGLAPAWAAFTWAVPFVVALPVLLVLLRRRIKDRASDRRAAFVKAGGASRSELLRYSRGRVVATVLEQALVWSDVVLVGLLAGATAAGVYGTAARFVAAGLIVDSAIRLVVAPEFSRLMHTARLRELRDLYTASTVYLVLLSWPVYLLLAAFASVVLGWLGDDFEQGAATTAILCLATASALTAGNVHTLLLMSGKSAWVAANKGIVVATNIVGNLVLVPRLGIEGAAAVWAASMLLDAALALVEVRLFLDLVLPWRPVVHALAVVLATVGLSAAVSRLTLGSGVVSLLVAASVGGCSLLVCMVLGRRRLMLEAAVTAVRSRFALR